MDNSILISLRLQTDIEHAARVEAAKQHISRSELVRRAISDYLGRLKTDVAANDQQAAGGKRWNN